MGLLDGFKKIRDGLTRTRTGLVERVARAITGKNRIDEEVIAEVEEALLLSDVGFETTDRIISDIRARVKQEGTDGRDDIRGMLKEEISKFLVGFESDRTEVSRPKVIMVVGVNGAGKTTTVGKLAFNLKSEGKKVLIAAADTFRAAANEQLGIWADRAGVDMIQQKPGTDPGAVAFDAVMAARARGIDVVLIDTAGRLHTKANLMEELKKITRVVKKIMPDAPHEVYLVLDAVTGQNGLVQARQFLAAAGVTAVVLTKLDGTARGGIVIAINQELKLPVRYIGVGEGIDDLQPFDARTFVDALFSEDPKITPA